MEYCQDHKDDPPVVQDDDADSRKKNTEVLGKDGEIAKLDQEFLFEVILVLLCRSHISHLARSVFFL